MSGNKKTLIGVGAVLVILVLYFISVHNTLVTADQKVQRSYADVQNVMQRQFELIPNLVASVKGSANFEQSTLTNIANARSGLGAVAQMSPKDLADNPELQKKLVDAQANMGRALVQLNAQREAYPDLKANKQFSDLMAELTGSQNRITVERRRNQQAIEEYNNQVLRMPRSVVASLSGFAPKQFFAASASAQSAPTVDFSK